ncbi:MAG: hypothetical protein LUG18_02670 [Candidatus Azobacteroides sp.]|nr:hypothetical protein [Candidatus Azobacteroides sp.]
MRKILGLLMVLIAFPLCAQRTTIKGKVVDSFHNPVAGMRVYTNETRQRPVYTNSQGFFLIKNVHPDHILYFGFPGYPDITAGFKISNLDSENVTVRLFGSTGNIYGYNKIPLEGIVVEIVNRPKMKTVTDKNGYFYLSPIKLSDELYIYDPQNRWLPQTQKVDRERKAVSIILDPVISPLLGSMTDTIGVTYLSEDTPGLSEEINFYVPDIKSISLQGDTYKIKRISQQQTKEHVVQFSSSAGISLTGRQPELQSEYAQGATNGTQVEWEGADKNRIFSWGPALHTLEFDGSTYPYDKNGKLVVKETGNGMQANAYNPKDFFRTGSFFENNLTVKAPLFRENKFSLSLGQSRVNSPIPNAYGDVYNGDFKVETQTGLFKTEINILGSSVKAKLMNNGASYARLLQSVYTTPASFDNSNALSIGKAARDDASWQLQDGSQRSYAPDLIRNPFYYVSNLPDKDKTEKLLAYVKTNYNKKNFSASASLSFNKQWDDKTIGMTDTSQIAYLTRTEQLSDLIAKVEASYKKYITSRDFLDIKADYLFDRTEEKIKRQGRLAYDGIRNAHAFRYGLSFTKNNHLIEVYNKHYLSNRIDKSVHFSPYAGVNFDLVDLIRDKLDLYFVETFHMFGSVNRSTGKAPLVYRDPSVLSSMMSSTQALQSFYDNREITFFKKKMTPETYTNTEAGFRTSLLDKFSFEFSYFNNTTWDMIAPVYRGNEVGLANIGRVRNDGFQLSAEYYVKRSHYYYDDFSCWFNLNLFTAKSRVTSVSDNVNRIQLAGFTNVGTYFLEGEPLGVIYGTTYRRSENNELIIGEDGFPLVDARLKKIGDPTPDFVLNFYPNFKWKDFLLSFQLEYSHGGDRWNGTQAYLDYLGMSAKTAQQRNIKGYMYDGVTLSGDRNSTVVDFYDPSFPVEQNRWVRYGAEGVGEEYIQDATYLRLSSASLFYDVFRNKGMIKKLSVGFQANNLFLITSYKGVDPASTLFGNAAGKGLDLFNIPSTRNYQLTVNIEL